MGSPVRRWRELWRARSRGLRAPGRHAQGAPARAAYDVPQARTETVELVFRDGTRVRLPEVEAEPFRRLVGDLKRTDLPAS